MTSEVGARQCPTCDELSPARAKFCWECGTRLQEAGVDESTLVGERRWVTVLFADLSGFTAYSELHDPEQVRALADDAAQQLGEIVERHGGTVDKIIGDAVMAVWGAPVGHEDDAERAVRAALEMQARIDGDQERFGGMRLSIGLNTGEAMWAPVGADGRYTVIGDTVNTAARLQGAAARQTTLVGEATYRASADAVEYEEIEPIAAKNKRQPVRAWRAVSIRGQARVRTRRAPLMGREQEVARLVELWDRSRAERRAYGCVVLGGPGIGKTRLLSEFEARLGTAVTLVRGRCLAYGEGITYWPVVEMLKQAAGILHDDDLRAIAGKLDVFLEGLGVDDIDELRTMAGAVSNLMGIPTTPRGTYRATEISKGELHWGLRRLFEAMSATHPVALVFEDLHWAEPTLLELLEALVEETRGPVTVLGTARPEFEEAAPRLATGGGTRRVLRLEPLSADDSNALVAALLGVPELPSGPIGALLRRAAGNPLFLEETVQMLADEGWVDVDGRLVDVPDDVDFAVPDELQALLGARLDRLPEADAALLLRAAVVGDVFWSGALRAISGMAEVDAGLERLAARGFVEEQPRSTVAGEREWVFHHGLVREVAYGRLAKAERFRLHTRLAEWVQRLPGEGEDMVEIVAHHLEQACVLAGEVDVEEAPPRAAAVRALTRAGERADGRDGTREAARYYERALAVVGSHHPETVTELRLARGQKLAVLGDLDGATSELEGAAESARSLERLDVTGRALVDLANLEQALGRAHDARCHAQEGAILAEETDDDLLRVRAGLTAAAIAASFDGATDAAIEALRQASTLADDLDDPELRVLSRLRLGSLLFNAGRLAEAHQTFEQCRRIGRLLGTVRFEALATAMLAHVTYFRGPRDEARALAVQALDWFQRAAHQHTEAQVLKTLALVALGTRDPAEAERHLDAALERALPIGGWMVADLHRYRTVALVQQGRLEEARAAVRATAESAPEEDPHAVAMVHVARGVLAAGEGDAGTCADAFGSALSSLESLGWGLDLLEARLTYAEALHLLGEDAMARHEAARARADAQTLGASALVDDIDRLLGHEGTEAAAS